MHVFACVSNKRVTKNDKYKNSSVRKFVWKLLKIKIDLPADCASIQVPLSLIYQGQNQTSPQFEVVIGSSPTKVSSWFLANLKINR